MRHSTIGSMIGKRSRMTCFFFFVKSRIHLMILVKMSLGVRGKMLECGVGAMEGITYIVEWEAVP